MKKEVEKMQKGTGFYKFVSVCYFTLAAIFSVCFAATALAWILLIIASGMLEGGMTFVINASYSRRLHFVGFGKKR